MDRFIGYAPEHICTLLESGSSGCVEMVNSRGIYLQFGCSHILLCHSCFGVVPNGVAVDEWDRLHPLLSTGQPVQAEKLKIRFPSGELELESIPKDARILCPEEKNLRAGIGILCAQAKETGLSSLVYPLFTGDTPKLNVYCQMALPYVQALLQALREENAPGIYESASTLLGLGPGLTPSGDDLLSGLLYGLRHSGARDSLACTTLTNAIRALAKERTNAVSADYLLAITEDAPFDRMAAAWADISVGAGELMQIGSNSGCEMLLGLLCAGSVLSDQQKTR